MELVESLRKQAARMFKVEHPIHRYYDVVRRFSITCKVYATWPGCAGLTSNKPRGFPNVKNTAIQSNNTFWLFYNNNNTRAIVLSSLIIYNLSIIAWDWPLV